MYFLVHILLIITHLYIFANRTTVGHATEKPIAIKIINSQSIFWEESLLNGKIDIDSSSKGIIFDKCLFNNDNASFIGAGALYPKVIITDIARSLEFGGNKSKAFEIAKKITDTIPATAKTLDEVLAQYNNRNRRFGK